MTWVSEAEDKCQIWFSSMFDFVIMGIEHWPVDRFNDDNGENV